MNCLTCQKHTLNPKFCSRSCSAINRNKVKRITGEWGRKRKERACKKCKKILPRDYSKSYDNDRKYVCDNCNSHNVDWRSVTIRDVKSKRTHQTHSRIRDLARVLFRKSEQKACRVCGYNKHIEVCHVKAIKDFPLDTPISEVNKKENLIGLCPNHHWEFDNGLLKL